LALIP